jgi:hypothetical protein
VIDTVADILINIKINLISYTIIYSKYFIKENIIITYIKFSYNNVIGNNITKYEIDKNKLYVIFDDFIYDNSNNNKYSRVDKLYIGKISKKVVKINISLDSYIKYSDYLKNIKNLELIIT